MDEATGGLPENREESPGGFAPFNNNDDNTNGIPDFADGYGFLWTPRVTTNEHFTELTINLPVSGQRVFLKNNLEISGNQEAES